jgi:hypothetical protein
MEWMISFELVDYLEANVKSLKCSQVCDASTDQMIDDILKSDRPTRYKPKLDAASFSHIVIPMVIDAHFVAMYFDKHDLDKPIYLDSLDYNKETYKNRRKKCYRLSSELMKIWGFKTIKNKIESYHIAD